MVRKKSVQRSLFLEFREPWQRGLAVALGLTLGLLPKFNLIFAALLLITLISPIPLALCFAIGCVASLISPQLSGVENWLGSWILGQAKLQGLWDTLFSSSICRAIGFQNTQVMGSLSLAIGCFYPVYMVATIFFQRSRQLNIDGLIELQPAIKHLATPPLKPEATKTLIHSTLISSSSGSPAESHSTLSRSSAQREMVIDTVLSQRSEMNISEADLLEAEQILNDLVTAKQFELNQHHQDAHRSLSKQEIEEQQWVLDTLIEIIRLKDEALKDQDTRNDDPQNAPSLETKNFLAPLVQDDFSVASSHRSSSEQASNLTNQVSENRMDKLTRTDSIATTSGVNAVGNAESVERMSTAPPSPVNVVPQSARPRSMHSRDESLRFLIHHLQCLQRERQE